MPTAFRAAALIERAEMDQFLKILGRILGRMERNFV